MSWEEPTGAPVGDAARNGRLIGLEISRRQSVVVLGGSVAAIAVAGGYGYAAREWSPVNSSLWTVRIVRAGRGARLKADGLPVSHEAPGPSDFSSHAVSAAFSPAVRRPSDGTVAAASAGPLTGDTGSHAGHTGSHTGGQAGGPADGHPEDHSGGGSDSASPFPQPANLTWGDVVVLEMEVHNTAAVPMLFSPGQLRLKLADGPTITPQDASRSPEAIAAGAVERLWVSYLAPSDATDFVVEFTDPLLDARLALDVPGIGGTKARS